MLGEVCTLVFIGHGWCSEQRSPEKSLYIHHAPFPVQHTSTHKHTHTHTSSDCSYLGAVCRCVYSRVRVCVCVRVQSETPVVVLKCKCMLEMTNLQQICFTWHTASSRVCICSIACKCVTVLAAVVSIVWAGPSAAGRWSFRRMNRCRVVLPPEHLERDRRRERQVDRVISVIYYRLSTV